jgi:hypothetical protein
MAIAEIRNFVLLEGGIATAGQPSEAQLRAVAQAGYTVVVNLGLLDPKYALPDEAGLAAALGLDYRHIPVKFDAPALDDFAAFAAVMDSARGAAGPSGDIPGAGPGIFVHCAANYRVSSFMAIYGELRLGWSRARADQHARSLWQLNPVWEAFLAACRARFIAPPVPSDPAS